MDCKKIIFVFICFTSFFFIEKITSDCVHAEEILENEVTPMEDNDPTPAKTIDLEVYGDKKKNYTGEIFNQYGTLITKFKTDDSGIFLLQKTLLTPNDNKIFIHLTPADRLIPKRGIGKDFKSALIDLPLKELKKNILSIHVITRTSSYKTSIKLTFIDKILGTDIENFKISLTSTDGKELLEQTDSNGDVGFKDIVPGQYTIQLPYVNSHEFVKLTSVDQRFFESDQTIRLDSSNGPPWESQPIYVISNRAIKLLLVPISLFTFIIIYISLGFTLPKCSNSKKGSNRRASRRSRHVS